MQKTIVIIDDSKIMVRMLETFFSAKLGFKVLATGGNGEQAVSLYRQHKPDMITLDLTMPVKDGKTAMEEILAFDPDARVMIISSITGSEMVECIKHGARGYVEKPLVWEDEEFVKDFILSVQEVLVDKAGKTAQA